MSTPIGRRPFVCGAAALCVTAVGGCVGYGKGRAAPPPAQPVAAAAASSAIAKVADIPVGGGMILADRQLVVTRPRPAR